MIEPFVIAKTAAGQEVLFCLAAGNRDPLVFDEPARWRPDCRGRGARTRARCACA